VDLDAVAAEVTGRVRGWAARGLTVEDLTWRDAAESEPQSLHRDRAAVADPESLGVTLRRGPEREAQVVLWRGGWADVTVVVADRVLSPPGETPDERACVELVTAVAELLLRS
jgi:hypothetical protein